MKNLLVLLALLLLLALIRPIQAQEECPACVRAKVRVAIALAKAQVIAEPVVKPVPAPTPEPVAPTPAPVVVPASGPAPVRIYRMSGPPGTPGTYVPSAPVIVPFYSAPSPGGVCLPNGG